MNKQNVKIIKSSHIKSADSDGLHAGEDLDRDFLRQAWIEIDLEALRHNIKLVKSKVEPDSRLMAVVKANAYGHGAVKVSEIACEEGVDYLGVAFLEEAEELRNSGIEKPIVLLYPENFSRSLEALKRGFIITVSKIEILNRLGDILKDEDIPIRYFLKINTGMNRYGIKTDDIDNIIGSVVKGGQFQFLGFTTNFAGSNGEDPTLSKKQEETFSRLMIEARERLGEDILLSFESSGYISKVDHAVGSLVRIGHLLYGSVNSHNDEFKPVMSVKSRIAEIQYLKEGDGVGYAFSFKAKRDMKIAVIPMGYADGYPWSLSNRGIVLTKGEIARVVGRICMDAFMVDISDVEDCNEGDEVIVMGSDGGRHLTSQLLGELAGSFSYEMMSRWSDRLPRIYK